MSKKITLKIDVDDIGIMDSLLQIARIEAFSDNHYEGNRSEDIAKLAIHLMNQLDNKRV